MKIHEYQAKEIFRRFGVPTPRGQMVTSPEQAFEVAKSLGTPLVVVKAQIHAGGRGKAGGVKLARSPEQAKELAATILGMNLVTPQTGPGGRIVRRVLVEEGLDIKRELYLSMLVDRALEAPIIMASTAGGVEIEEVAAKDPRAILRETVRPATGLQPYQVRKLVFGLGLGADAVPVAMTFLQSLYRAFSETDASLAEINPLIVTGDGKLIALDAKMTFDDNALYRHKELADLRDAGLAMATMDIVKLAGGAAANFLDVGGGASAEQVKNAFRILMSDPEVRGVFINIFGGILRCDVLAGGVVAAARELQLKLPVVIRMEGTNVERGQEILRDSGLNFTIADGMKDGAEKAVRLAGGAR